MAVKSKDVKKRPAGKDDMYKIVALDINKVIENDKYVLKANKGVKVSALSTELEEGMSIKAYSGGRKETEVER